MGTVLRHTRQITSSWAALRLDDGSPCFVSVANTGVLIKKSRLGLFGKIVFKQNSTLSTRVGFMLSEFFPERSTLFPRDLYRNHFILSTFSNALLHLQSIDEASLVFAGILEAITNGALPPKVEEILDSRKIL